MLWTDGRSGAAGCVAGNMVVQALQKSEGAIQKLKGTTFESSDALLIGRVCATDEYLREPLVHWANASWDQHLELKGDAESAGKKLVYLFITASSDPAAVRYWRIPAQVVELVFRQRGKTERGDTCAIHISTEKTSYFIGKADVTKYFATLELDPARTRQLREAFGTPKSRSEATLSQTGLGGRAGGVATFDIPATGARSIRLQARLPLSMSDIDRLKRWIDLTADVLTEPLDEPANSQTKFLREQIQAGLDDLERGDTVDGEAAFDQVLNRRRKPRGAA